MRTIAALTIAIATWIGAQAFTAPTTDAWELGERVSQTVAADLAEEGAPRFDLGLLWEQDAEWLPELLLEHGWTSVAGDGCECVYPPAPSVPTTQTVELDDLAPAEADVKAAELAGEGWTRIPGECNCWTQA